MVHGSIAGLCTYPEGEGSGYAYRPLIHNHIGVQQIGTIATISQKCKAIISCKGRVWSICQDWWYLNGSDYLIRKDDDGSTWMRAPFCAGYLIRSIVDVILYIWKFASARNRYHIHKSCSLHLTQGWGIGLRFKTELYVYNTWAAWTYSRPPGRRYMRSSVFLSRIKL